MGGSPFTAFLRASGVLVLRNGLGVLSCTLTVTILKMAGGGGGGGGFRKRVTYQLFLEYRNLVILGKLGFV